MTPLNRLKAAPLLERGREPDQGADVFAERPQQQNRLFAFGLQAFEQLGAAADVATHPGRGKLENVETGDVGHCVFRFGQRQQMAFGVEQGEFVDFLRCRQQIAFTREANSDSASPSISRSRAFRRRRIQVGSSAAPTGLAS